MTLSLDRSDQSWEEARLPLASQRRGSWTGRDWAGGDRPQGQAVKAGRSQDTVRAGGCLGHQGVLHGVSPGPMTFGCPALAAGQPRLGRVEAGSPSSWWAEEDGIFYSCKDWLG